MLLELTIKNFTLMDDLNIKFSEGMNVLMGETGSGKSNIIDAVSLLSGSRVDKSKIRKGRDNALISAVFEIPEDPYIRDLIDESGIILEEDLLIISKEIKKSSSTISRINDCAVTNSLIKKILNHIVDIYGQFENIKIFSQNEQRKLLDRMNYNDLASDLEEYSKNFKEYKNLLKKIEESEKTPEEIQEELSILNSQKLEIERSEIFKINEEEIFSRLNILDNMQSINENISEITGVLESEQFDILEYVSLIKNNLYEISEFDKNFTALYDRIEEIEIELKDIKYEISDYKDSLFFDEEEYNKLDSLRNDIFSLKKKYGNSIEDIKEYYDLISVKINELLDYEYNIKKLKENAKESYKKADKLAGKISDKRKKSAKVFSEKILEELKELEMKDVTFDVNFSETELKLEGKDEVTFMVSFNRNENLKPLQEVASGGEISRFMLAVKSIEADIDNTPTIIFDEIDTGISGNAGMVVSKKLKSLSKNHQLICISHLPQIISRADSQFLVYKTINENSVSSNVKLLDYQERITELAKVIEGNNFSEETYKTAENMIKNK